MKLETIKSIRMNEDVINIAFSKGYLDTMLKYNSIFKLELMLTIFVDDNCICCIPTSKVNNITIDNQLVRFVVKLDNDININCDRIDVKKWNEE